MGPDLQEALQDAQRSFPAAAALVRELLDTGGNLLGSSLGYLIERHGAAFWARAESLARLSAAMEGKAANALLEYTMAYLREQAAFLSSGSYPHSDFEEVRGAVYDNADVMRHFYLEGLMLTHAFWPIHFDLHAFFAAEFLTRVPPQGAGTEVGFGHGLYLLEILQARPQVRTRSFDISPHAVDYASKLLAAAGITSGRFELELADVRRPLPLADASQDWIVFAEVLEHLPEPAAALAELRRVARPGCPLFVTTAIDSAAIDHVFRFSDLGEVRDMLHTSGLRIDLERVLKVTDYQPASRDPTVDVALICTPQPAAGGDGT